MSTLARLLARKQRLMDQLENDPGPNEREEIERVLSQIETALTWLDPKDNQWRRRAAVTPRTGAAPLREPRSSPTADRRTARKTSPYPD